MYRFALILLVALLLFAPAVTLADLDTGLRKMKQEQDREELVKLEKSATTAKDFLELARRYRQGVGTAPDLKKYVSWSERAAEKGSPEGAFAAGYAYYTGNGVTKSLAKGVEWFTRAANAGQANAQYYLAGISERGEGLPEPDMPKAASWYKMAAERGHSEAMFRLGMLTMSGSGVAKNEAEGRRWLKAAAAKGHILAKSELERQNPSKQVKKEKPVPVPARQIITIPIGK